METDFFQKELLAELGKQNLDFVHFVDISHLTKEQNKEYPTAILIGMALPTTYLQKVANSPDYVEQLKISESTQNDEFHLTEMTTDKIADHLELFLVSNGFKAYSQSENNILKTGQYDEENRKTPLPHKTIAGLAGLGWIGKHNLLITKEYGSAVSMCSVLTNAPLKPSREEVLMPRCNGCNICVKVCKPGALKGETWTRGIAREKIVDVFSCTTCFQCVVQCPWTQKYIRRHELLR